MESNTGSIAQKEKNRKEREREKRRERREERREGEGTIKNCTSFIR